ncbi:MAG TPA: hypothetical protein PKY12_15200, partial [Catalimonadaceae bacterium]|nr:hypothetical protein [Catalimonadaceae bacterium]
VNESEEPWTYYYFGNEFYNYVDNSISGALSFPTTGIRYAQTSSSQTIPSALTGLVDLVCDDVFNSIVFPLRPQPQTGTDLTQVHSVIRNDEPVLGQNIPNPATSTTSISFYLPQTTHNGRLELFDLATGRVLKGFDILRPGHGAIEFETRSLPGGVFGYRLVVNEQPVAHKKMVVTH